MSLYKEVETIKNNQLEIYKKSPIIFKAEYENQKNMEKEYNGRQLLEILQNADDSHSKSIEFKLDVKNKILEIRNDGEPFSVEGIQSLMIANASPKRGGRYIGNKGLGFRSLVTWSDKVEILSQDCLCTFSRECAKKVLYQELGFNQERIQKLRKQYKYSKDVVFFPFFGIPQIEISDVTNNKTIIRIYYLNDYEEDIKKQLNYILKDDKSLLFLDNLKTITVSLEPDKQTSIKAEPTIKDKYTSLKLGDDEWFIVSDTGKYPDKLQDGDYIEDKHYSAKIAWKKTIKPEVHRLYSFFPTQITLPLPCVIHGSFEIDTARNHLISESEANKFVFDRISDLMKKAIPIIKQQSGNEATWDVYHFLNCTQTANDSTLEYFYSKIQEIMDTEKIFPTINDTYVTKEEYKYYSDEFNSFMEENYKQVFTQLIKPGVQLSPKTYEKETFQQLIDTISFSSETARAQFIMNLYKVRDINPGPFNILVNDSNEVISSSKPAYTAQGNKNIIFPKEFVSFDLIKKELYDALINTDEYRNFTSKTNTIEARKITEMLSDIVNIQPYDIAAITERIINQTNIYRDKKTLDEQCKIIKKMVQCLYHNFKLKAEDENIKKYNLFLISRKGTIEQAENLYFSETYKTGKEVERIFGNVIQESEYLIEKDFWGLEDDDDTLIDDFFKYFGVHEYFVTDTIDLIQGTEEAQKFFNYHKKHDSENHIANNPNSLKSVLKILNFDKIMQLTDLTDIVLMVYRTKNVLAKLTSQNYEQLEYQYYKIERVDSYCSYIAFQFITSGIFNGFLIDDLSEDLLKVINEKKAIDFDILKNQGIPEESYIQILKAMGAKQSFTELPSAKIYEILSRMPVVNRSAKNISTIYKMAREALDKNNENIDIPSDLQLYAIKEGIGDYFPYSDVLYSDNNVLPKKISDAKPMLCLPRRNGEDKVKKYFGVTLCKTSDLTIINPEDHRESDDFDVFFTRLKPYILAYRIASQKEDKQQKDSATKLSHLSIRIIKKGSFRYKNDEPKELSDYEFVIKTEGENSIGFIKVPNYSYKEILNKVDFQTSFSEIISIVFKLTDSSDIIKDVRSTLSYSETDLQKIILSDLPEGILEKSYDLLNISISAEYTFWNKVCLLCDINEELPKDVEQLRKKVKATFDYCKDIHFNELDYETFLTAESIRLLRLIQNNQSLQLRDIFVFYNLFTYHKNEFKTIANKNQNKFNELCWDKNRLTQKQYKDSIDKYNQSEFEGLAEKYKCLLIDDYDSIFYDYIKNEYGVDLSNYSEVPDFTGKIVDEYLPYKDKISNENQYLLYYPGNLEKIIELINEDEKKKEQQINTTINPDELQFTDEDTERVVLPNKTINPNNQGNPKNNGNGSSNGNGGGTQGGVVNGSALENTDLIGAESERKVITKLEELYGAENVKWVSKYSNTSDRNDHLHYDIMYRESDNDKWRYLEVKTFSAHSCDISSNEIDFALQHKLDYDMAFVEGNQIHRVKEFFNLKEGQTIISNDNFTLLNKNYKMYLNFSKKDKLE